MEINENKLAEWITLLSIDGKNTKEIVINQMKDIINPDSTFKDRAINWHNTCLNRKQMKEELLELEMEVEDITDQDIETSSSVARYEYIIPRIQFLKNEIGIDTHG